MRCLCCCCLRNSCEKKLYVVQLIRLYQWHADNVSDDEVGTDSDTDSDDANADESADELVSASESVANQSSASGGKH